MKSVQWKGNRNIQIIDFPIPKITEPKDAIIHITTTSICGSDLHLYHNEILGMEDGDILGHEMIGFVEEVGTDVKNFKVGDRVVVSCVISCGECFYCKNEYFSCCDCTNDSKEMEEIYGHHIAGFFGYSHLTGGYPGGQAEFCRVPFADNNLLKVPDSIKDESALFLSDVLCTSWHACEMGEVGEGKTVAIWGIGPVGLLTAAWAKYRGASRIICIDKEKKKD